MSKTYLKLNQTDDEYFAMFELQSKEIELSLFLSHLKHRDILVIQHRFKKIVKKISQKLS